MTAGKQTPDSQPRCTPPDWPPEDEDIRAALEQALADGSWGKYHGPATRSLVEALAALHGLDHVTLCCSGTVAVELALRGVGVGPEDEVVLAGYDFPGNFRAIEAIGAVPVLVDIDPQSWCIDPQQFARAIGPATRAVLVSHLHGGLAAMRAIRALADEYGLRVVEDACQAPGAEVDGQPAGAWGDAGVLSFGGSKLLTAGRGGAVLTRHADIHQRMKIFAQRGNDAFPLSELQAAVLLPQLTKLAARNAIRRQRAEQLLAATEPQEELVPLTNAVPGAPSYYKLAWRYRGPKRTREEFIQAVQAAGVALDAGFRGFTLRSARRCRKVGALPHSAQAAEQTVLLHHPVLLESAETVAAVAQVLLRASEC